MKAKELRKILGEAREGSDEARRALEFYTRDWSVFVLDGGELDIDATAGAIQYRLKASCDPDEWDDIPTVGFDKAFVEERKLNPLTLKPVTPGTWGKLWELENGHRLAAIIYYGRRQRHIVMGDLEVRDCVKSLVNGTPWGLLQSVAVHFDADADGKSAAMAAVVGKRPPPLRAPLTVEQPFVGGGNDPHNPTHLRTMMMAGFTSGDVRTLCFDLGLDYDDLREGGKTIKVLSLIDRMRRYRQMEQLVAAVRQANPSMFRRHFGVS